MTNQTKIEWTERTWNPIVGCSLASPGCTNCYAMRTAWRMSHNPNTPQYHGTARVVNGKPVWTGKLSLVETVLDAPLRRKKPTTYFVNSMADLFHEDVPDSWIDQVFAVMALAPQHIFQVLTKRADRMLNYLQNPDRDGKIQLAGFPMYREAFRAGKTQFGSISVDDDSYWYVTWPLPNVWLGVSVEDQKRVNERIPALLATPAALRFVSVEPMLGPVDLTGIPARDEYMSLLLDAHDGTMRPSEFTGERRPYEKIDWIICGGESGPRARPMHPDWARDLRDQCQAAGTAFLFKQWGAWVPLASADGNWPWNHDKACRLNPDGRPDVTGWPMQRVAKKTAGRQLDGREWNQFPEALT